MAATALWMCRFSRSLDSLVRFLFRELCLGISAAFVDCDFEMIPSRRRCCPPAWLVANIFNRILFWPVAITSQTRLAPPVVVIDIVLVDADEILMRLGCFFSVFETDGYPAFYDQRDSFHKLFSCEYNFEIGVALVWQTRKVSNEVMFLLMFHTFGDQVQTRKACFF